MTAHRETVEEMSLRELLGQTMVVPIFGATATKVTSDQAAANRSIYGVSTPREVIEQLRPGGVLLQNRIAFHPTFADLPLDSVISEGQLGEYTEELQSIARMSDLPSLMIVADQEGGRVNRLPVTPLPAAATIGATGRRDLARRAGELTARIARSLGVNVIFGPVADVGSENAAIGDRAFGSEPDLVADMVAATVEGIAAGRAGSVAKHWPGHGRADADSHESLPRLSVDLSGWHAVEVPPFRAAVRAGVDAVAVAHVSFPAADPTGRAASVSAPVVNRLRSDADFDGVVFSDALWMPGIRRTASSDSEIALAVLAAGIDVLLAPPDPHGAIELASRSTDRDETRLRLEQAVIRSLSLRARVGGSALPHRGPDWSGETTQLIFEIESAADRQA